jgi:NADH-quinone oxidoreductase subunit M
MAMIIAGKLGLYSLIRFHVSLFPEQAKAVAPLMIALAAIGILYGATVALTRKDMKQVAAFATLSGLGFCVLGIYAFALSALDGAVYQTVNEAILGGALLILLGFLYERYETNDALSYGGLAARMPMLATIFVITSLGLVALPLFNSFVGEFLILSGSFVEHKGWVTAATAGVILSVAYMLVLVQKVFFGAESDMIREQRHLDLRFREQVALWPMVVLMLAMGVASPYWMRAIDGAAGRLLQSVSQPAPQPAASLTPMEKP